MTELHLIVLWEKARVAEERILADIREKLELVTTGLLSWPGDAERCFGEFYGAKLPEAKGKVAECGSGTFRYVVVRDTNPRYAWEDTSRGLERVNETLFTLKNLYRSWTGGGHKVHTTNSPQEFARDIKLLTNHSAEEWEKGLVTGVVEVVCRDIIAEISAHGPFSNLMPIRLDAGRSPNVFKTRYFSGEFEGRSCFIKFSPVLGDFMRQEWRVAKLLHEKDPKHICEGLFWHRLEGGGAFVATEWIEGETLDCVLHRGAIGAEQSDRLAADMVALARLLKDSGIVHRDVRPSNLMVSPDGSLKLIDFQFAIGKNDEERLYQEPAFVNNPHGPLTILTLGEDYAFGPGRWNDAYSLRKCLKELPQTPGVRAALATLDPLARTPDREGLGSRRLFKRFKRRFRRLGWHRLLAKLGIGRRHYREEEAIWYLEIRRLLAAWKKFM